MKFAEFVNDKNVLFITTKNIDYIRNTQEIRILKGLANQVELIYSDKKNYVLRILHVWSKMRKVKVHNADVVFAGFSPQLVVPFVGFRLKEKPIIIDFFISVYDTLVCDRKKFKDGGVAAKICHKIDEITLRAATHIITDTKAHASYFISEFNCRAELFETIYLEADSNIYYPRPQNKLEELKDKFVVLYFGNILPLQGVEVILDAIRELKDHNDIYFDIIGPIPKKYNKPIQDNVCYTEWLPQDKLAEHIANADLCLAGHFSNNIEKAKRTIPGKAYIYEMMKKKMILGNCIANQEIFNEDKMHSFIEMGNAHILSRKIVELRNES